MIFLFLLLTDPTVNVSVTNSEGETSNAVGCFVLVGTDVYVATAKHVVDGQYGDNIKIRHRKTEFAAEIAWLDPERDVAILRGNFGPRPAFEFHDGDLDLSEPFLLWTFHNNTVHQIIPSEISSARRLFFDVSLEGGDSGGFVLSSQGRLVGVISGGWIWRGKTTWPTRVEPIRQAEFWRSLRQPKSLPSHGQAVHRKQIAGILHRLFRRKTSDPAPHRFERVLER